MCVCGGGRGGRIKKKEKERKATSHLSGESQEPCARPKAFLKPPPRSVFSRRTRGHHRHVAEVLLQDQERPLRRAQLPPQGGADRHLLSARPEMLPEKEMSRPGSGENAAPCENASSGFTEAMSH